MAEIKISFLTKACARLGCFRTWETFAISLSPSPVPVKRNLNQQLLLIYAHGIDDVNQKYTSCGCYQILEKLKASNEEWLARSVATIIDPDLIHNLHASFTREGVFSIASFPLGGSSVLLNFESSKIMEAFLSNGALWLQRWFTDFQPCQNNFTHSKKSVWVKLCETGQRYISQTQSGLRQS